MTTPYPCIPQTKRLSLLLFIPSAKTAIQGEPFSMIPPASRYGSCAPTEIPRETQWFTDALVFTPKSANTWAFRAKTTCNQRFFLTYRTYPRNRRCSTCCRRRPCRSDPHSDQSPHPDWHLLHRSAAARTSFLRSDRMPFPVPRYPP